MAGKDGMSDEQPDIPSRAHSDGRFLVKLFLARILLPGMALLCLRRVFLCLRCIPGSESVAACLRGNPRRRLPDLADFLIVLAPACKRAPGCPMRAMAASLMTRIVSALHRLPSYQ